MLLKWVKLQVFRITHHLPFYSKQRKILFVFINVLYIVNKYCLRKVKKSYQMRHTQIIRNQKKLRKKELLKLKKEYCE